MDRAARWQTPYTHSGVPAPLIIGIFIVKRSHVRAIIKLLQVSLLCDGDSDFEKRSAFHPNHS